MTVATRSGIFKVGIEFNLFLNYICYAALAYALVTNTMAQMGYMLLVYAVIGINEQAFFHRQASHKSWQCPTWLKAIGLWIGNLSLLGPVLYWVAIHRKHHPTSDTAQDPHSPLFKPNWWIQFRSSWLDYEFKYVPDILQSRLYMFFTFMYLPSILITWITMWYLLGTANFISIYLAGTAIAILTANSINTWHHGPIYWFGQYRNYKCDTSKNDLFMGYFHFDGWHNNHHGNARPYYYGQKWWEIDVCGIYIWLLATLTGYNSSLKK